MTTNDLSKKLKVDNIPLEKVEEILNVFLENIKETFTGSVNINGFGNFKIKEAK